MIILNNELFIGEGRDKTCYLHPSDKEKCIKILKNQSSAKKRMLREIKVHKRLEKKRIKSSYIAAYFGKIETNLGLGYIFEYVEAPCGKAGHLESDCFKEKIVDIYKKCYANAIPLCEVRLDNLVLNKNGSIQIVDGLGWAEFIPICYWSKFFARRKIKKNLHC